MFESLRSSHLREMLCALVLAVASVACGGAPEGADALGEENTGATSQAITNGADDDADPAVVALLSNGEVMCTGVLVTHTVVLTAGHCVQPTAPDAVFFGSKPRASGGTLIQVRAALAHPDFDPDSLANDIGLVALASRAPTDPVPVRQTPIDSSATNAPLRLVGFGSTGGAGSTFRKRSGNTKLDSFTDSTIKFHASPSQTCNGDSGGAAFGGPAGNEALVGITSSGDSDCKEYGVDTRVDPYVDFISTFAVKYSAVSAPQTLQNSGCASAPGLPSPSDAALLVTLVLAAAAARRRSRS
jgi:MYXO-CTERM domain-containing protein